MIVSPQIYGPDVVLSYDVMPLSAASVLVVELAAHNQEDYDLLLPADYNVIKLTLHADDELQT